VDCLFCDGSDQAECVRSVGDISRTLSCHGSCFTGLYPRNQSDSNPVYDLACGCLDELEYDDREACAAGTLANCVSCSGASCNTADVPENRLSCNVCQDAECETTVSTKFVWVIVPENSATFKWAIAVSRPWVVPPIWRIHTC